MLTYIKNHIFASLFLLTSIIHLGLFFWASSENSTLSENLKGANNQIVLLQNQKAGLENQNQAIQAALVDCQAKPSYKSLLPGMGK